MTSAMASAPRSKPQPNRVVTLDANTRVGQAAICAALQILSPPYERRDEVPALSEMRKDMYAALSGQKNVDRCVVASDGAKHRVMIAQGTPHLHHEQSEGFLDDLIGDPPDKGIWIFEGRITTERVRYAEGEEWETDFPGDWRAVTEEDRQLMEFTDRMIADDAREWDISITVDD